jgi:CheY-like chemotaxis protein
MSRRAMTILLADDDPDDRLMAAEAFAESLLTNPVVMVEDGEQLLDYLTGKGAYAAEPPDLPGIILLDLNMPRKDGRQALLEIKSHPDLRRIPVVVLTTSKAEEDILRTYDLGVNSFITKPVSFDQLVDTLRSLGKYWFEIVELPSGATAFA